MQSLRILIVEDDPFTRATVKAALQLEGIEVLHDTASVASAMKVAQMLKPDAAVIDLDLGVGPNGVDLALGLRRLLPKLGIVLLTGFDDARFLDPKIAHLPPGSRYVVKHKVHAVDTLIAELRASLELSRKNQLVSPNSQSSLKSLPDAQIETLRMIAFGLSNAEISRRRCVTEKSVEQAISRLVSHFELGGKERNKRVELTRIYLESIGTLSRSRNSESI